LLLLFQVFKKSPTNLLHKECHFLRKDNILGNRERNFDMLSGNPFKYLQRMQQNQAVLKEDHLCFSLVCELCSHVCVVHQRK